MVCVYEENLSGTFMNDICLSIPDDSGWIKKCLLVLQASIYLLGIKGHFDNLS